MARVRVAEAAPAKPPSAWSLVGRQEELALCESCVTGELATGVVIAGAAGVGKTRLLSEALGAAAATGRATASVTATEAGRTIPLAALAHLLPVELARAPTTFDVISRARAVFADRSRERALVLAVDDAHLLDPASATLVHQLVVHGSAVVLLTVRSGEPAPDVVTALWKDRHCAFLELQPLSRQESRSLVESVLGGELDGLTERALWDASRGVPLVLRELVLDGLERGLLRDEFKLWRWHGELTVGRRLHDLVASRIGDLDDAARETLELTALGEPLSFSLTGDADAVDRLVRRGVLVANRSGRRLELRFSHPLHGEVVRSDLPPTQATMLARRLADSIEATGARRSGDLLRLASWRLEGGGAASSSFFLAAACRAELSFAPALAERLARAAIDCGGGAETRYVLARALIGQGRFDEADEMLALLEGDATEDAERATIAETRARILAGPLGRGEEAANVVAAARETVDDPSSRSRLVLAEGWILYRLGGPARAVEVVEPTIEHRTLDASSRLSATAFCVTALAQMGRPSAALELAERFGDADGVDDMDAVREAAFARSVALLLEGRIVAAGSVARDLYAHAIESGDVERLGRLAWWRGNVALCLGDVDASRRSLRESVTVMREVDPRGLLPWALAMLAQAAGHAGDAEEARSAVEAAHAVASPGSWIYTAAIELGRAWANAAEGAFSAARRSALAAAEIYLEKGQLGAGFLGVHDLARFGEPEVAAPRLAELACAVEGDWVRACADHATALVASDAEALRASSRAFEEVGALLFAAEALGEAATAFRRDGRLSSARSCAARARILLRSCAGACTPALRAIGEYDDLTRREREIATLAAGGLSNREIAKRLSISVRTVENQLQRAYGKLGITGRHALETVIARADAREVE